MDEKVKEYISKYPPEIIDLYGKLRALLYESVSERPEEKLWAKLPSYYVEDAFVRLIPFKDHINIQACGAEWQGDEWQDYKKTPKGMLQIFVGQAIPCDGLKRIFREAYNLQEGLR